MLVSGQVEMFITITSTDILFVVKDEGRGFINDPDMKLLSIGMQSIKDRVHTLGGTADWVSEIGKGTELLIRIPY